MERALGYLDKPMTDHIDRDKLNNTRENLRLCTSSENNGNVIKRSSNTSGYKGVYKYSTKSIGNGWIAIITCKKQRKIIGVFRNKLEAARAYDKVAIELFGEYARLNNIGVN